MVRIADIANGQSKEKKTQLYHVSLLKNDSTLVKVMAIGMNKITEDLKAANHRPSAGLFPDLDSNNWAWPISQKNLLMEIHILEIHPMVTNKNKHKPGCLQLLTS